MTKTLCCLLLLLAIAQTICASPRTTSQYKCDEPRIRRPWRAISAAERSLFLEALLTAKQMGYYDQFIALHKSATNAQYSHGTSLFLPWHRWYLYQFENFIRSLSPRFKCLTVPYWDWERDAGREAVSKIFDANLGSIRVSNTSQCVRDGLFSVRNGWVVDGRCLKREYDPKITFVGEINLMVMLGQTSYTDFRLDLEARAHGAPHAWLNGDMGDFTSPNDPMFFLHHSNIDRLWSIWQDCHDYDKLRVSGIKPGMSYKFYERSDPLFGDITEPMPYTYLNGAMEPFLYVPGTLRTPSVRDVFHIMDNNFTGMHYGYDPADNLVSLFNKFNPTMCKWDWFLGAPTQKNKDTWGISWLRRLSRPPRLNVPRVTTLASAVRAKRSLEAESAPEWFTEALTPEYNLKWKYLNSTHFRMRISTSVSGWAAVGFNPDMGGMSNCDMVIVSADDSGKMTVGDYFSETYGMPQLDERQSLSETSSGTSNGGTWMEFTRPFKTNDPQDKEISLNGKNTIVWAYGRTPYVTKHERNFRGFKSVNFPEFTVADSAPVAPSDPAPVAPVAPTVQSPIVGTARLSEAYYLSWKIENSQIVFTITLSASAFASPASALSARSAAPTAGARKTWAVSPVVPSFSAVDWVAIGFNPEDRGMLNADMIVAHIKENKVLDYVSTGYMQPQRDTDTGNKNNILKSSITVENNVIRVVFTRALNSEDSGDRPIFPGKMDVIWAYGAANFSKHWVRTKGVASINFFAVDPMTYSQGQKPECKSERGRWFNGTCECFLGYAGKNCEKVAAFPNISIAQLPNTQLRDSLRRLRFKNMNAGKSGIPAGAPGNREYRNYISALMSRAYKSFSIPHVGSPRIDRLFTQVIAKNPLTKKLSMKDQISILLVAECAATAGNGRQYISDDWLTRNSVEVDKNWAPACPTKTCCSTSKMVSDKLVCKNGGIAQPVCNTSTCTWNFDCAHPVDVVRGKFATDKKRTVPGFSERIPAMSRLKVFAKLNSTGTIRPTPRPATRPTTRPVTRPTTRPSTRPTRPGTRPSTRPVTRPTARPVTRPTTRPATRPSTRPVTRPSRPTTRPVTRPTTRPVSRPVTRPATRPVTRPSRPTTRPVSRPVTRPTARPVVTRPTFRPVVRPVIRRPVYRPVYRPNFRPSGYPFRPSVTPFRPIAYPRPSGYPFRPMYRPMTPRVPLRLQPWRQQTPRDLYTQRLVHLQRLANLLEQRRQQLEQNRAAQSPRWYIEEETKTLRGWFFPQDTTPFRPGMRPMRPIPAVRPVTPRNGRPTRTPSTRVPTSRPGIPRTVRTSNLPTKPSDLTSITPEMMVATPAPVQPSTQSSPTPRWPLFAVVLSIGGAVVLAVMFFMVIPGLMSLKQ